MCNNLKTQHNFWIKIIFDIWHGGGGGGGIMSKMSEGKNILHILQYEERSLFKINAFLKFGITNTFFII